MKQLAKILVTASMATLLGMSSTADAKGSKKSKAKRATPAKAAAQPQAPVADVPWYEQGIEDLAPVAKAKVKPAKAQPMQAPTPSLDQLGSYQRRKTLAPSGLCTTGCDKTARNISMATLVLVKDRKATQKSKSKKPKAHKSVASKKVSRVIKQVSKK